MRFERSFSGVTLLLVVAAMLVTGLCTLPAVAQTVVNGDVSGTITDAAGAVVSGATVTITDATVGKTQSATTSATGLYRFSFLKPGDYKVSVAVADRRPADCG